MNYSLVNMSQFLASVFNAVRLRRLWLPGVSGLLLAGCVSGINHHASDALEEKLPQQQLG
ncbi:Uncharacterised protein [Yokenella regensburgei]|nr:Uncharacterised protein [Yokenella regensburgei]